MDLSKSLNLFRNNGATPFQYIISYSELYTRNGVEQTAHMASDSEVEFRLTGLTGVSLSSFRCQAGFMSLDRAFKIQSLFMASACSSLVLDMPSWVCEIVIPREYVLMS